jgi:hypothetical protein
MTVIMQQTMPEGMTVEMLDEVTQQMGVLTDPPAGLIVHTHFRDGGQIRVVDVWDSRELYESFVQGTLMPAMQKVAAGHGVDMAQASLPEPTFLPVQGLVKGR